jgi:hypothetical protein
VSPEPDCMHASEGTSTAFTKKSGSPGEPRTSSTHCRRTLISPQREVSPRLGSFAIRWRPCISASLPSRTIRYSTRNISRDHWDKNKKLSGLTQVSQLRLRGQVDGRFCQPASARQACLAKRVHTGAADAPDAVASVDVILVDRAISYGAVKGTKTRAHAVRPACTTEAGRVNRGQEGLTVAGIGPRA